MTIKRVPSFSTRPDFPKGLQVLVVDNDAHASKEIVSQLDTLGYIGTVCNSCGEALECIETSSSSYDVVLAEARMLTGDKVADDLVHDDVATLRKQLVRFPLVLMSEDSDESQVLSGIKLGACDFLDKPLSTLKLKNIWQHVVRRKMVDDEKSTSEDEDDIHDCLTDEDCIKHAFPLVDKSKVTRAKSDASLSLQCPKTPSPAGSAGDVFSIVASQGKQLSEHAGESATSEATKEETSTRTLRTVKRRNSLSGPHPVPMAPMCPPPGMMMMPPGMMMVPPSSPPNGCYYMAAPMYPPPGPMSCMPAGFMPTPMVPCGAQASSSMGGTPLGGTPLGTPGVSLSSSHTSLPEGLFAADATCAPPCEPDLSLVSGVGAGPIGLALKKSSSLLNLLDVEIAAKS